MLQHWPKIKNNFWFSALLWNISKQIDLHKFSGGRIRELMLMINWTFICQSCSTFIKNYYAYILRSWIEQYFSILFSTASWFHMLLKCTVWKLRILTLTLFWQKFRESIILVNKLLELISWNTYFLVRGNFRIFPHCEMITFERGVFYNVS